jgi:hypothetical protein
MGSAVVLGQLASSSAFAGVDSAAHMAEEVSTSMYREYRDPCANQWLGQRRLAYCSSHDDADYPDKRRTGPRSNDHSLFHDRGRTSKSWQKPSIALAAL